jgi:hypothetical protein
MDAVCARGSIVQISGRVFVMCSSEHGDEATVSGGSSQGSRQPLTYPPALTTSFHASEVDATATSASSATASVAMPALRAAGANRLGTPGAGASISPTRAVSRGVQC